MFIIPYLSLHVLPKITPGVILQHLYGISIYELMQWCMSGEILVGARSFLMCVCAIDDSYTRLDQYIAPTYINGLF